MPFKKIGKPQFKGVDLEDFPKEFADNTIYVIGEKAFKWVAAFRCPCGCQEIIQLNLLNEGSDQWKVIMHRKGFITVKPSIWRTVGCKSHFTIKKGYLNWVPIHLSNQNSTSITAIGSRLTDD